jgi:Ca2+-binding EF-hand superfamily protein
MKLRDPILYTGLILLLAFQIVSFKRLLDLEKKLPPAKSDSEGLGRGLASLQKTVEALSSAQRQGKSLSAADLPGSAPPRGADLKEEKEKGDEMAEASEEEGDSDGSANEPIDPSHPLARRKQFLEDMRLRLRQLDSNADSQISIKEFDGDLADFSYFDKNGNGRLSLDEVQRAIKVEEDAVRRVAAADKNGDGLLSPREYRGSPKTFRFLDANGDGEVSVDEYVGMHRRISQRLDADDIDHDHRLGKEEFGGSPAKFAKYDKNKDGVIDRSELKEMLLDGRD